MNIFTPKEIGPALMRSDAIEKSASTLLKMADGIKADVRTAHSERGGGASEWMREDDRDFRKDLREAFEAFETALQQTT
tara:strand:- start:77 stop:313 length:237 start_codon:yes stop_codon:yes gene_type:complete